MALAKFFRQFGGVVAVLASVAMAVWVLTTIYANLPNAPTITVNGNPTNITQAITDLGFLPAKVVLENLTTIGGIVLAGIIIGVLTQIDAIKKWVRGLFEGASGGY